MLGVFKKRWKPKNRAAKNENGDDLMLSCGNEYSEPINAYVLPADSRIAKICSARQNMFPVCDNNSHYSVTYETLKPVMMQSPVDTASAGYGKPETVPPPVGGVPGKIATVNGGSTTTPNICIEGGRIEFVKSPIDCGDEKQDYLKEYLEAKIVQLESELVAERRSAQRERTLNSKLQKQLARREWLQRDVDRERRLRLDTEARLKGSSSEADRCRAKLSTLQKDVAKMEETIRTLLQYKSKFEQLKQDRHSAANSYENQILQLQNAITKLKIENETLKKQINTLEATGISQVQKALVERLRTLEHEKNRIEREGEQQRKQYEKCLDDVAKQVVKAVLSQKGLREEKSSLQNRVKELETGNCALSALLVQRLGQKINYSPTAAMPVAESRSVMFDIHRSSPMKMSIERPASCDLTKGLKKLKTDGWQAAVSYHRPQSLNLEICCSHNAEESTKCDRVLGDETPESGNRDEGYSTMSSDVQGTTEPPSTKGLEDVKEANENESNVLMESSPCSRALNSEDTDVIFVPLSLSFSFINPRHSYPPLRCLSAVPVQHIMRSYSDSHLFLKLAAATGGGEGAVPGAEDEDRTSWYSGGELWDMDYVQHWLRLDETRAAIQQRMEYDAAELEDWTMDDGAGWKRISSAADGKLQQSLPCIEEDAAGRGKTDDDDDDADSDSARHMSWHHYNDHLHHLHHLHHHLHHHRLPHEDDDDDVNVDVDDDDDDDDVRLRQHHGLHQSQTHRHHRHTHPSQKHHQQQKHLQQQHQQQHHQQQQQQQHQHQHQQMQQRLPQPPSSPGDSWSSADEYGAAGTPPSKRSSASYSDSIELLPPPVAGTDFTRDFYRLVKFESSKSLASTSTGGERRRGGQPASADAQLDREQALQSVLDFIAEQQQYCMSRQAEDRREPPPPPPPVDADAENVAAAAVTSTVTSTVASTVAAASIAATAAETVAPAAAAVNKQQQACDSNSCSDNLLNSKDSGLCGSDVEIECLPDDCYCSDAPAATRTACSTPRSCAALLLRPVPEEDEDSSAKSTSPQPSSSCGDVGGGGGGGSSSACTADTAVMVAAWSATASSRDLIDQLIRMSGDDDPSGAAVPVAYGHGPGCTDRLFGGSDDDDDDDHHHRDVCTAAAAAKRRSSASSASSSAPQTDLDEACCCPTGWVHVERDIDFADPKERANLLDVMLMASSRSSSSSATAGEDDDDEEDGCTSGGSGVGCCRSSGSVGPGTVGRDDTTTDDCSSDDEREADDDDDDDGRDETAVRRRAGMAVGGRAAGVGADATNEESYNRLHRLHRVRRQKKASAIRDGFGVLRCPSVAAGLRQSIVGRSDFFVRFGDKEREAMSNFDFLDELSTTSVSTDSGDRAQSPPPPGSTSTAASTTASADKGKQNNKYYSYTCSSSATATAAGRRQSQQQQQQQQQQQPQQQCAAASRLPSDGRRQRRRRYSGLSLSDSCGDSD